MANEADGPAEEQAAGGCLENLSEVLQDPPAPKPEPVDGELNAYSGM